MIWTWSFRAFRLFGTEVRIHWSLPAVFFFYVLRAAKHGATPAVVAFFVVIPYLLLVASVLAHEYGHVFAARRFGLSVGRTILTPIGGMVMVGQARTPRVELLVALAGPAVNLALATFGCGLYLALVGLPPLSMLVPFVGENAMGQLWISDRLGALVLYDFARTNMFLLLFNMVMVAYPMDGGRALMATLWKSRGYRAAVIASCKVSRVGAGAMVVVAILTLNPMLAVIAIFLLVQATITLRQSADIVGPAPEYATAVRGNGKRKSKPKPKRPSWLARIRARGEQENLQRYLALIAKSEARGLDALTAEEREFLDRARRK